MNFNSFSENEIYYSLIAENQKEPYFYTISCEIQI